MTTFVKKLKGHSLAAQGLENKFMTLMGEIRNEEGIRDKVIQIRIEDFYSRIFR